MPLASNHLLIFRRICAQGQSIQGRFAERVSPRFLSRSRHGVACNVVCRKATQIRPFDRNRKATTASVTFIIEVAEGRDEAVTSISLSYVCKGLTGRWRLSDVNSNRSRFWQRLGCFTSVNADSCRSAFVQLHPAVPADLTIRVGLCDQVRRGFSHN